MVECVLVERLANEEQNEENKEEGIHNEGLVMRFPLFFPDVKLSPFDLERLNSLPPYKDIALTVRGIFRLRLISVSEKLRTYPSPKSNNSQLIAS